MATITSPAFKGLSIQDAEIPATRTSLADNPVHAAMQDSNKNRTSKPDGTWVGKGKSVTVPAELAIKLEGFVRQSAEALNVGSVIRLRTPDDKIVEVKSVGGTVKTNPATGKKRRTGGTLTAYVGSKVYTGDVTVFFQAKSPRKTDKASGDTPATPAAAPSAQVKSEPAPAAPAAPAASK